MKDKKTSVFGIYPSLTQAERGVDALVQARFATLLRGATKARRE